MDVTSATLTAPESGYSAEVIRYGQWGRPLLLFPAEAGSARDLGANGIIDALSSLIEDSRLKVYCVDSADASTWSDRSLPLEERSRRHDLYEQWITGQVVPWIDADCGSRQSMMTAGVSLGAFHAVNLALRHADLFPVGIGLSGNYDPSLWDGWGERGDASYFHNPTDYVSNLDGGHLDWLRSQLHLVLVVGEGAFEEHPTRAQSGSRRLAALLAERGLAHELDIWGPDAMHDWPAWRRQLAHHAARFC
ncbi:MAG: esterase family protein [Jatrophihabitans sp.]